MPQEGAAAYYAPAGQAGARSALSKGDGASRRMSVSRNQSSSQLVRGPRSKWLAQAPSAAKLALTSKATPSGSPCLPGESPEP